MVKKVLEYLDFCSRDIREEFRTLVVHGIDEHYETDYREETMVGIDQAKKACQMALDNQFYSIEEKPLDEGVEVIGFNKEWIDEDFNPNGTRIGFLNGNGEFTSAVYESENDTYTYCQEEGDDYDYSQKQDDGSIKTWYYRNGEQIFGYRPNMPTHYMFIPKFNGK